MQESLEEFEIRPNAESAALERLKKKSPLTYKGKCVAAFSQLFLIGSFSNLQVMMTYIRAWLSFKFGQIQPRTTVLAALERQKSMLPLFSVAIYLIHFKSVGIEDMHTILSRSGNFDQIGPDNMKLSAFERLKMVFPLSLGCFQSYLFDTSR